MKAMGLEGVRRGRRIKTTQRDDAAPCPLDRVKRQFRADRTNALWVADFTYCWTWSGFVYVAFVTDVFARRIVGWRVSASMRTDFVLDALNQALHDRQPPPGLIHHSDHGSQGGFNWSSQHLQIGGVEWDDHWDGARNKREGPSCDHLADRVSITSIRSEHSGRASHKVWRPRPQRRRVTYRNRWGRDGFVKRAAWHRSTWRHCRWRSKSALFGRR